MKQSLFILTLRCSALLYSSIFLFSCNSNRRINSTIELQCPSNAPLFTAEIGNELINTWGNRVINYTPKGPAGYTDVYVSAAYFTGINYFSNGVLVPTVSPMTRSNSQEIYDYFTHFLNDCPVMTNNPGTPQAGGPFVTEADCGQGVISGYYNFVFACVNTDGEPANARYTFQFQYKSTPSAVSIRIASGPQVGEVIQVDQPVGWYIMLQNSAKLP